jgi:hypothetical protein
MAKRALVTVEQQPASYRLPIHRQLSRDLLRAFIPLPPRRLSRELRRNSAGPGGFLDPFQ